MCRYLLFLLFYSLSLYSCSQNGQKEMDQMTQTNNQTGATYLALGDSYTIGQSVAESERWPVQLVDVLNAQERPFANPEIIARTGWTTGDLLKELDATESKGTYDWVSLLIGVNNQYQGRSIDEYSTQFEELLKRAIAYAGGKKDRVFVVSIPDYAYTPFGGGSTNISQQIDAFNAINQSISGQYEVHYVNITDISRKGLEQPDLVASDGLHPSGKMYAEWVSRITDQVLF